MTTWQHTRSPEKQSHILYSFHSWEIVVNGNQTGSIVHTCGLWGPALASGPWVVTAFPFTESVSSSAIWIHRMPMPLWTDYRWMRFVCGTFSSLGERQNPLAGSLYDRVGRVQSLWSCATPGRCPYLQGSVLEPGKWGLCLPECSTSVWNEIMYISP